MTKLELIALSGVLLGEIEEATDQSNVINNNIAEIETRLAELKQQLVVLNEQISELTIRKADVDAQILAFVAVPSIISPTSISAIEVGSTFNYQIVATDNPTSYKMTYATRNGAFIKDHGLVLNQTTGLLSGKFVRSGMYRFTLVAINSVGTSANFKLNVNAIASTATVGSSASSSAGAEVSGGSSIIVDSSATSDGSATVGGGSSSISVPPIGSWGVPIVKGKAPGSYRVWPNHILKNGPSCLSFNGGVKLRWKNLNGDWTDRNGTPQGNIPWYVLIVPKTAAGYVELDITELVQRWQNTDENRGIYLKMSNSGNTAFSSLVWAGTYNVNFPQLVVSTGGNADSVLKGDLCAFTPTTEDSAAAPAAVDSGILAGINSQRRQVIHFNGVSNIKEPITKAVLKLYVDSINPKCTQVSIDLFETDPPPLLLGGAGAPPIYGLAMEIGEENLSKHPDVLMAGDFREENWNDTPGIWKDGSLGGGKLFSAASMSKSQYLKSKVLPDPEHPGRFYLRTCVAEGQVGGGEFIYSWHKSGPPETGRMPDPNTYENEIYSRIELWLEEDSFWSNLYAFKLSPVGMKLQYGKGEDGGTWNGNSTWIFGSGQTSGDGKRYWSEEHQQWILKGHSIRGHMLGQVHPTLNAYPGAVALGIAPSHLGPYDTLRNGGVYGTEQNFRIGFPGRDHCIPMGRWVTIESRCKVNSIDMSVLDAAGNGRPRHDGIWEMFMDGVLVGGVYDMAWHCHPSMGIRATWTMVYHGGNTPTDHDIYYRYRNPAIARRYIGPARRLVIPT